LLLTHAEAESLLYQEARLLDERRLEDWLGLFTEDGLYWLPMAEGTDPLREPSLAYDDAGGRAQRVYALLHTRHHSQIPPSRTLHCISNLEMEPGATDTEALVRCNLVVYELRPGHRQQYGMGKMRALAGRGEYRLRFQDGWKIALKKILLLDSDQPMTNLTFIV